MLGLGDGAGGGEGGGVGGGGGWELQQGHGRLWNDNEAISRAWKCLLLWRISIVGGAFTQEEAREQKKKKKKWYMWLQGESPTYILNEDTQPVIRAIGVSHTACKDEFRQNIWPHSWNVFQFLSYTLRNDPEHILGSSGFTTNVYACTPGMVPLYYRSYTRVWGCYRSPIIPGTCTEALQIIQKLRLLWHRRT